MDHESDKFIFTPYLCMGSHAVIGQDCRQKLFFPAALQSPYWAWFTFSCSASARCYIFIQAEEKNPGNQFKKNLEGREGAKTIKASDGHRESSGETYPRGCNWPEGNCCVGQQPLDRGTTWKPKDLWNAGSFQQPNIWWSAFAKCSQGQCRGSKLLLVRCRQAGWEVGSSAECKPGAHERVLLPGSKHFRDVSLSLTQAASAVTSLT